MFGEDFPMSNLTKSSIILNSQKNVFQTINVDSRTPEQVAADVYGDPKLFWVILFVNDIIDPFNDWYMMEDHLEQYCLRIYGEEKMMEVLYFTNNETKETISGEEAAEFYEMMENDIQLPEYIEYVTNFDYEKIKNENKKTIKIVPPSMITKFIEIFKSTLKG